MYIDFNVKDKNYKLRLATRNIIALEKAIGCNPLGIFKSETELPEISTMVTILFHSLQKFQHGISFNDAENIFDEYLEDHSATDFIYVILDIYKVSGIIRENKDVETNEKN